MSEPYKKRGLAEAVAGNLYLDSGGDHRDAIFVAGSGRSGTTWLSNLINHENRYRYIFEPFDPEKVPLCKDFRRKQYLRPDDESEEYFEAAKKILVGALRHRWSDRFNRKVFAKRRLIKDIRANLLLGWMRHNFPGMPVVLLLRHPCAVTDSRIRLGWRDNLADVMTQSRLLEDHLKPFEKEIPAANTAFERSIFLWCIENCVPLRQPGSREIYIVFYEKLLAEPESELTSLFEFLGEDFDESLVRKAGDRERYLTGWTERISGPEVKRACEILGLFGLDRVYGEDVLPSSRGVSELASRGT
ncbi:MAG: sulfotransferase [Rubrobacteraceae bacterium]